ncbi:hypothetical protein HJFPF1_04771 [Paramyrothecium foliicola]|nr:hypothetical protein HJFPF1_04771 [Paramyrothecium foliicola]
MVTNETPGSGEAKVSTNHPLKSQTLGPSVLELWESHTEDGSTIRRLKGEWVKYALLSRAASIDYKSSPGLGALQLRRDNNGVQLPVGLYLGFSSCTMEPVFMKSRSADVSKTEDGHISKEFAFWTEPSQTVVPFHVNPHHGLLVPGNIEALGDLAKYKSKTVAQFGGPTILAPFETASAEHQKLLAQGRPATPLLATNPNQLAPSFAEFKAGDHDTHWALQWPLLSAIRFPKDLVRAVTSFIAQQPKDCSADINTFLAAVLVYFDLEQDPQACDAEVPISTVSLAVFVLYFPHMLRMVARYGLARHFHPVRFAKIHYEKDVARQNVFVIEPGSLDTKKCREWCKELQTIDPRLNVNTRVTVYPYMFPGSGQPEPTEVQGGFKRSLSLWSLLKLPDVRTLGLPTYNRTAYPFSFVLLPAVWSKNRLRGSVPVLSDPENGLKDLDLSILRENGWLPLVGGPRFAGPVWDRVKLATKNTSEIPDDDESINLLSLLCPPDPQKLSESVYIDQAMAINKKRHDFALKSSVALADIDFDAQGLVRWQDMEANILDAFTKANQAPEHTNACDKPRHYLDIETRKEMFAKIDRVPVRSGAWGPFCENLCPESTVDDLLNGLETVNAAITEDRKRVMDLVSMIRGAENGSYELCKYISLAPMCLLALAGENIPPLDSQLSWTPHIRRQVQGVDKRLAESIRGFLTEAVSGETPYSLAASLECLLQYSVLVKQDKLYLDLKDILEDSLPA